MRAISGLVRPDAGEITIAGRVVSHEPPQRRRAALVFASDALIRTMSVRRNLELVAPRASSSIVELARALDVERHLEKRPGALSTGERQRVSIARAVLADPKVLLLDEPLAPLDPHLRLRVRDEIIHVRERFGGPIVFVTHDHADALSVADDLAVLIEGRIEDYGDPARVYERPATLRAAALLGARPMNLIPGERIGWDAGSIAGFRPERVQLRSGTLRGVVTRLERTGADVYVHLAMENERILARVAADEAPDLGAGLAFSVPERSLCRYDSHSGTLVV